jgi:hypothetical protein
MSPDPTIVAGYRRALARAGVQVYIQQSLLTVAARTRKIGPSVSQSGLVLGPWTRSPARRVPGHRC